MITEDTHIVCYLTQYKYYILDILLLKLLRKHNQNYKFRQIFQHSNIHTSFSKRTNRHFPQKLFTEAQNAPRNKKHEFNYNVNGNNIWKVIFDFYVNYIVFIQVYIVIFMHDKIYIKTQSTLMENLFKNTKVEFFFHTTTNIKSITTRTPEA